MRPNYPVMSTEMLTELREIQETLMSMIGYDANAFDNKIDVSGSIDIMETTLDNATYDLLQNRNFGPNPTYRSIYYADLVANNNRGEL